MPSLRPLNDRVLIKRREPEIRTASGIVIPDSAGEKPEQGDVLGVGPGQLLDNGLRQPPSLKVGDRVLFGKYSGQSVKLNGEELLVLREDDVLAVIDSAH